VYVPEVLLTCCDKKKIPLATPAFCEDDVIDSKEQKKLYTNLTDAYS